LASPRLTSLFIASKGRMVGSGFVVSDGYLSSPMVAMSSLNPLSLENREFKYKRKAVSLWVQRVGSSDWVVAAKCSSNMARWRVIMIPC
jgi:hypothetical protein